MEFTKEQREMIKKRFNNELHDWTVEHWNDNHEDVPFDWLKKSVQRGIFEDDWGDWVSDDDFVGVIGENEILEFLKPEGGN